MNDQPRQLRPELLRIAGTLLAAIFVVIVFALDLGETWLLLAVIAYGLSTALFGLVVVTNWRGIGDAHRARGTVGFTGWVQLAVGSIMIAGALIALVLS
ncbi:MAG TPA: hypothetical protein VMM78_06450 [Thermomicrobiales bacterium]|nr:hypothetical protein [Thermomicrobiales bacterium]